MKKECYLLPVLFLVSCGELCRTIVFVLVFVLTGCASTRQIQVVERVSRDTLYLNHLQYDSIYIDNWQLTDRSKDTVYVEKVRMEYKYRMLRDTVRVVKIDTIPVIRTVEVVKTERYIPTIYKWSLGIVIALVFVFVFVFVKKFFL